MPMLLETATTPTLAHVLRHVAELIRVPEADIVAGGREGADEGRDLFVWLARHVSEASPEAVAFFVRFAPEEGEARHAAVEARRRRDRAYQERLDEAALELHVEAALARRRLIPPVPDRDAARIAARVLSGQRQVLSLPVDDLVRLAAAYEALLHCVGELRRANTALLAATHTVNERPARQAHAAAVRALFAAVTDSHPTQGGPPWLKPRPRPAPPTCGCRKAAPRRQSSFATSASRSACCSASKPT